MRRVAMLGSAVALVAMLASAAWFGGVPRRALAHGDEIEIAVTPLQPDPANPLRRLYRVAVTYESDGEPVEGAEVRLRGRREPQGDVLEEVSLTELPGGGGIYAGEVVFSRFGSWVIEISVSAAFGQGEGEVSFTDDVSPVNLSPEEEAAAQREAERVIRLQTFFGFDPWPDAVNIVMRATHSLAGAAYFAMSGVVLLFAWTGLAESATPGLRRLLRLFGPVAMVSLTVLLAAGVYEMFFDGPVVAPGIFDLEAMRRLPYGEWYLAAFALKPLLFAFVAIEARLIHRGLREFERAGEAGEVRSRALAGLRWDTAVNGVAGVAIVIVVASVIYLHYVSHLGVLLPE